jgi:hypothetical protein
MISILDLAKRRAACRRTLFVAALVLMLLLLGMCLRDKVLNVEASVYSSEATELQVSSHWRYGYIATYHGARLVRTPNVPLRVSQRDPESDDVWVVMNNELRLVPLKAVLETALYLLLLIYGFFLAPWIAASIRAQIQRRILRAGSVAVLWAVGWTIVATPNLMWGYGEPIYSTWSGPGALSSSGPYLCSMSYGPGLTVSYRGVFEATAPCLAAMLFGSTGLPRNLPELSDAGYLWLLGVMVYGIMGPVWQYGIRAALKPRELPICPICHSFVDPGARKCSCGLYASSAYPLTGALLVGLATGIGCALFVAALLDATDLHENPRIAIAIMLLLAALVYGAMEIRTGVLYRKAPYPTSRLARSHLGVGVGMLCIPMWGLIACLLI